MVINIKSMPKHTEMIRLRLYREGSFIIKHGPETLSYLRPPKEDDETEEMDVVGMTSIIRDRQDFFKGSTAVNRFSCFISAR